MRYLSLSILIVITTFISFAACNDNDVIIDDWGAPAGYALIEGTVKNKSGDKLSKRPIFLNYCLWDSLSGDTLRLNFKKVYTDSNGHYKLTRSLPPVGAFPSYDGNVLQLKCEIIVGRSADKIQAKQKGMVNFYSKKGQRKPSIVNILMSNKKYMTK